MTGRDWPCGRCDRGDSLISLACLAAMRRRTVSSPDAAAANHRGSSRTAARSLIPVAFISRWILAHSVSRATHARMKSVSRQPRPAWAMPLAQHLDAGRYRNLLTALGGVVACTSTSSAGRLRYTLLGLHSLLHTDFFTSSPRLPQVPHALAGPIWRLSTPATAPWRCLRTATWSTIGVTETKFCPASLTKLLASTLMVFTKCTMFP